MITAYNENKSSEICPFCGEVLWAEWGYWSEAEYSIWCGLYHQWDMQVYHYHQ